MANKEIIYRILKSIEQGVEPTMNGLGVEKQEFLDAAEQIDDSSLLTNVGLSRGGRGNPVLLAFFNNCELTELGQHFINTYKA